LWYWGKFIVFGERASMNMVGRERGKIKFMVATVFMIGLPHDRQCFDLMVGLPIKPLRVREDKSPLTKLILILAPPLRPGTAREVRAVLWRFELWRV
jgi:hypothetical protein